MPDVQEQVSYEENTVEELRDELRARDLPTTGNKAELVARLEESDTEEEGGALATTEEGEVSIEPLVAGGAAPVTNWQSWVAQQGGIQPTVVNAPPYPPSTSGGTPGTMFPGIQNQTALITGTQSTPTYDDVPTYRKPPDLYQGWTVQIPNTMVIQPFPPPAVLIASPTPKTGPSAGGTVVTLNGVGFTGATAVNFGATPGTAFSVVNDQTIKVTTPAGSANTVVNVTVVNASKGNATLPQAWQYGA